MVGSFIIFLIVAILRITAETLLDKFSFLEKVIPYLNYGLIGAGILFAVFTLVTLLGKLFSKK